MNLKLQSILNPKLNHRLTKYAAAGVTIAAPAVIPNVGATVIDSGPANIAVPQNVDGVYLSLTTGVTGATGGAVPGFDINMYGTTSLLWYFGADVDLNNGGVFTGAAGTPANKYVLLQAGAVIGPASTFSGATTSTYNSLFRDPGATGYLGLRFTNETTGAVNYGYIHFRNAATTGTSGFPATILDYSYQNNGTAITVVPEPGVNATLGAMAVGALGLRQWRRRRQAAA